MGVGNMAAWAVVQLDPTRKSEIEAEVAAAFPDLE